MNKKVIIFGGSSGLGLELAKTFGHYQKEIIISSSNEIRLKKAHQTLDDLNIKNNYFKCDLSNTEEIDSICEYIKLNSSSVEAIIFCSAKGYFGKFEDLKLSEIEKNFKINSFGFINILNKSLNYNQYIRYIYISSYASKISLKNMSIYSFSKIILEKIFESIKLEYEPGKTLIAYPGPMDTNFDNNSFTENSTNIRIAKKKFDTKVISKKIYKSYIKKKEILEINSGLIKIVLIFKNLFSNQFYKFLRFFN